MENSDYSKKDILIALRNAGIDKSDDILVHSNLGFFGKLDGNKESVDYCQSFAEAIFDIIGEEGTLIVPTFTYSFCWNEIFDLEKTLFIVQIYWARVFDESFDEHRILKSQWHFGNNYIRILAGYKPLKFDLSQKSGYFLAKLSMPNLPRCSGKSVTKSRFHCITYS